MEHPQLHELWLDDFRHRLLFDLQRHQWLWHTRCICRPPIFSIPAWSICASSSNSVLSTSGRANSLSTRPTSQCPAARWIVGADAGSGGLMSITGQNVDLSSSTLTLEGGGTAAIYAIRGSSYAGFGIRHEWGMESGHGFDSRPRHAVGGSVGNERVVGSARLSSYPVTTTPYVTQYQVNTNRFVSQYVFLGNTISNVTASVELLVIPRRAGESKKRI